MPVRGFCVAMTPSRDDDAPDDVAEIAALWTEPGHRRAGIAWDLMTAMQRALAQRGFRGATLWVRDDNAPARGLYRRLGWEQDGARKADADAPELRLRRALP